MSVAYQRTPEWHAERRTGIGSSDAPIIAGVVSWGDVRSLWAEKVGLPVAPVVETDAMRWGRLLEDVVATAYTEQTKRELQRVNAIQRHPQYPYMLASLDRRARIGKRLVEIKTAGHKHDGWGEPGTNEIPEGYMVQVQHQLAVTGYPVADVPVLFGGREFHIYTVPRDEALIEALIEMEAAFWKHVVDRTPPTDAPRLPTLLAVEEADADERTEALVRQVIAARRAYTAAESEKEVAERVLREHLDNRTAVKGTGWRLTYKPNKPSVRVGWEQVAHTYRGLLEQLPGDVRDTLPLDPETIEGLYTTTKEGARPLVLRVEGTDD